MGQRESSRADQLGGTDGLLLGGMRGGGAAAGPRELPGFRARGGPAPQPGVGGWGEQLGASGA